MDAYVRSLCDVELVPLDLDQKKRQRGDVGDVLCTLWSDRAGCLGGLPRAFGSGRFFNARFELPYGRGTAPSMLAIPP